MLMSPVQTLILSPGSIDESRLTYVVIAAREKEMWVFVRHRDRSTWEMPAGHIEKDESARQAALRELQEETGTVSARLNPLCDYQVSSPGKTEWGRLYGAEILDRNKKLEHEIVELKFVTELPVSLTYPEVQTVLFQHADELLRS